MFDANWRPDDWDATKRQIIKDTPVTFSPSTGYSKGREEQIMEKAVSVVLAALVEVLVTGIPQ